MPRWLSGKELSCNADAATDVGSIPGSGRSPGGGHGSPLQYSCLVIHMERGSLEGYSSWGHKSVRYNLVTKQQKYQQPKMSFQPVINIKMIEIFYIV